ncbi:MAG: hypothetical protein KBG38_08615 [Candidatus Cloacimonas sp.]|nr:hypothetical protein [Candidatus Cloacimonas sp.]
MPELIEERTAAKNNPQLEIGMLVEIRPVQELKLDSSQELIDCGWNEHMAYLSGKRFVITEDMYARYLHNKNGQITKIDGYYISPSMLKIVNEEAIQEQEPVLDVYRLRADKQDPEILAEMIGKVDRTRFKKLLCIASCDKTVTMKTISDEIVDLYLYTWAKAKYEFYLLFGKQLSLSKQIQTSIDIDTMRNKIRELQFAFPQYANLLGAFSPIEFIENKCDGSNSTLRRVYDKYQGKAKLSKVLAGLITDKEFNDALAMLFSSTTIQAVMSLSIDPFDYLTISVNKYDWSTCQRIGDINASYGTGAGSIMLDEATIVAFGHGGKDVMYHMNNMEFSGNSKFWRECMYIDKDSGNFVASREYPSQKELLAKEARTFLEDTIAEYMHVNNQWLVTPRGKVLYTEGSQNLYHDVLNDFPFSVVHLKDSDKQTCVTVGKDIFCLKCGEPIGDHSGRYLCDDDYDHDNVIDRDEIPF